jgi:hypothetical protein
MLLLAVEDITERRCFGAALRSGDPFAGVASL